MFGALARAATCVDHDERAQTALFRRDGGELDGELGRDPGVRIRNEKRR